MKSPYQKSPRLVHHNEPHPLHLTIVGVSGISCPGRLLQVGNLARLPIFFMGFRLDLAFVGAEVEGPTRSVGGSSSDPTNAARAGLAHMRRRAACERPKIALL